MDQVARLVAEQQANVVMLQEVCGYDEDTPEQLRRSNVMTLTAPGDTDRDGRNDLLARDTRNGDLWLYRGRDDGRFDGRTLYGHGYDTTSRPLLAGAADADGNGAADMWTTTDDGTGTLLFYAGGNDTSGQPVDGPRTLVGPSGRKTIRSIS
ncbi:FG-GAP-like repeat-containing protein [Streptomyces sp. NPDC085596]|uniref:FG-GAP-like repeat-containing protein n=1 Tax=Streptomyces sp. NPDC085596 TaxID=3365731 RepID=UPI0037D55A94